MLFNVEQLSVGFTTSQGLARVVDHVSFSLRENEVLGIVGESGSGKTQLMLSILRLQARNAQVAGKVEYLGKDCLRMSSAELARLRCNDIAMVFQDPMSCLNPYLTVATQLCEALIHLQSRSSSQARADALAMLEQVQILDPVSCMRQYPHQLSGGMRQRVMLAMALLRRPRILIADEPTTALDVTVQAEILELLHALREQFNLSVILITHDMSIVAGQCDRVLVMYAGQLVEVAETTALFDHARHPYTQGLLQAARSQSGMSLDLYSIPGQAPPPGQERDACVFCERCDRAMPVCAQHRPALQGETQHQQACHLYDNEEFGR